MLHCLSAMQYNVTIDRNSNVRITDQIANQVRDLVRSGTLAVGQKLPPITELRDLWGVSVSSLQQAFSRLAAEGIVSRSPRLGTFVQACPQTTGNSASSGLGPELRTEDRQRLKSLCAAVIAEDWALENSRLMQMIQAFESSICHHGGRVMMVEIPRRSRNTQQALDRARLANAVFLLDEQRCDDRLIWDAFSRGLPVVAHDYPGNIQVNGVSEDWDWAMREVMRHLIACGHRRIALASLDLSTSGQDNPAWVKDREGAFLDIARLENLPVGTDDIHRHAGRTGKTGNAECIGKALGNDLLSGSHDYTAIIGINDAVSLGILEAAGELGLEAPRDFSLAGFDNPCQAARAGLTSVLHSSVADGQAAADMLVRCYLYPDDVAVKRVINRPCLIVRSSTG